RGPVGRPKKHVITPDKLADVEKLYTAMLPLPNPDAHEVIGAQLEITPYQAFFGINLIRQKLKLPKIDYPKRPLAVTPEQLEAVKTVYEPYLPKPPIGIHKIISKQLRMDEWRVHVAIGLIRKQMALPRWNEDRDDLPPAMKQELEELAKKQAAEAAKAEKEGGGEKEAGEKEAKAPKKSKKADSAEAGDAAEEKPKKAAAKKTTTKKAAKDDSAEGEAAEAAAPVEMEVEAQTADITE
ncbi:MAG: hypothetical protein KC474_11820, partial [Cyanobacteria bacterium HKST-UBA04]|nr:hypothetical protein [Cyanobacteria bacterium HKST-UBA04]